MFTVWIPFPKDQQYILKKDGGLCIANKSHLDVQQQQQQEQNDLKEEKFQFQELPSNYNKDQYKWVSSNFEAGDFVLFDIHSIHGGARNNNSKQLRISIDIRIQPYNQIEMNVNRCLS